MKKCNTSRNTDRNILLRNNVFYYRVELPRQNGKRRFLCKSLRTYNYYEAREKAKIMSEKLKQFNTETFMNALNALWEQVIFYTPRVPNGIACFVQQIVSDKTRPEVLQGLIDLADYADIVKTNQLSPGEKVRFDQLFYHLSEIKDALGKQPQEGAQMRQLFEQYNDALNKHIINSVVPQPKIVKHTIGEVLTSMIKSANNGKPESDRKYLGIKRILQKVGLNLESDYMDFYNHDIMQKIIDCIRNMPNIVDGTKRKYTQYIRDLIKYAHVLEPDTYKENLINILPKFDKTPKSKQKPHMPYTKEHLVEMFDPKYNYFKNNPDQFWVCMIALFTGSRLNASMTLQYRDVFIQDGLYCIQFIQNHPIKHLKTEASERIVPIPKQLLDLGFVDYVRTRQMKLNASGTDFIFPKCQTTSGQENNKFVARGVLKFLSDIGIKSPGGDKLDFHSFRKNASLQLQNIGVLPSFINDIIGWDGKNTMEQSYSNHRLSEIKEQIDKLNYDFLQPHFDKWKEIMKEV